MYIKLIINIHVPIVTWTFTYFMATWRVYGPNQLSAMVSQATSIENPAFSGPQYEVLMDPVLDPLVCVWLKHQTGSLETSTTTRIHKNTWFRLEFRLEIKLIKCPPIIDHQFLFKNGWQVGCILHVQIDPLVWACVWPQKMRELLGVLCFLGPGKLTL